jgi:tagatose 1,6-diphosphate aldolase
MASTKTARKKPAKKASQVTMGRGKFKGLMAVSDRKGVIRAAAMDQRGSLQKSIAKAKNVEPSQITYEMMSDFKTAVSKVLTPHASAILLDPEFGLEAVRARAKGTGVLLAYEQTGYDHTLPGRVPTLIADYSVKTLIEDGGDCVKLLIYYTPEEDAKINAIKHAFVRRIGAECAHYDVPFFLEFVGYDPKGGDEKGFEYAKKKPEIVRESMREFSKPEYLVDVLKVEIPVNMQFVEGSRSFKPGNQAAYTRKEASELFRQTAKAAKKPFIYLSAGVSDDEFRDGLELAIESRVEFSGVLCGRATWKEGIPVFASQGAKALEVWLRDRGVANITALNKVLDQGATSWLDFYGGKSRIKIS